MGFDLVLWISGGSLCKGEKRIERQESSLLDVAGQKRGTGFGGRYNASDFGKMTHEALMLWPCNNGGQCYEPFIGKLCSIRSAIAALECMPRVILSGRPKF